MCTQIGNNCYTVFSHLLPLTDRHVLCSLKRDSLMWSLGSLFCCCSRWILNRGVQPAPPPPGQHFYAKLQSFWSTVNLSELCRCSGSSQRRRRALSWWLINAETLRTLLEVFCSGATKTCPFYKGSYIFSISNSTLPSVLPSFLLDSFALLCPNDSETPPAPPSNHLPPKDKHEAFVLQ